MESKTEKAYCCGNSVQREATLISKFDFVVSTVIFFIMTIISSIIASSPESLADITSYRGPENKTDVYSFLTLSGETKGGIMSYVLLVFLMGMALAVLLFVGARKRRHSWLLFWFFSSSILFVVEVSTMIVWIVYSTEQTYWSCILLIAVLYKWYCLWIVKVLMREIRTVAEGYANPLDSIEPEGISNGNIQELDKF